MSSDEWAAVVEIREALVTIAQRLSELIEAVHEMTRAIEQAAEETRDVRP